MDVLGQFRAGQRLSDRVVADVGDLAQTVEQAERLKDASIDADADIGIASLDLLQGRTGREGALRDDGHWQPPTPTGVVDVCAELTQDASYSGGRGMRCRHLIPSHYGLAEYVARRLQSIYLPPPAVGLYRASLTDFMMLKATERLRSMSKHSLKNSSEA